MTTIELLNRLKAKTLEKFAQEQEEFIRCCGTRSYRNSTIDARLAEVKAATRVGDILHALIKLNETGAYDDDAPTFRRLPQSAEHEKVYWFILRELGAADLTLEDVQLRMHPSVVGTWDPE